MRRYSAVRISFFRLGITKCKSLGLSQSPEVATVCILRPQVASRFAGQPGAGGRNPFGIEHPSAARGDDRQPNRQPKWNRFHKH